MTEITITEADREAAAELTAAAILWEAPRKQSVPSNSPPPTAIFFKRRRPMADTKVLTRDDRIALARQYHAGNSIIQGAWQSEKDGRNLVCALAAFGPPGEINRASDCPADLMPQWLAELVPAIDDGIAEDQVPWFSGALIDRAERWHILNDAAWKRIHTGILVAGVRQAIAAAGTVHQTNPPEYWPQVTAACEQVCTALGTGDGLPEAEKAADAARAAANAAYVAADAAARAAAYAADEANAAYAARAARAARAAAYTTARAAARAAAYVAVDAAYAAAYAAARAAAYATARAAWKAFAETLFRLIDVELDNAEAAHV